jgi:anthranilate/para-aminobenzoate synthase component II
MKFEDDAPKGAENKRKHGIDFEEASGLWEDSASAVSRDDKTIFHGLPSPMTVTRYHSLIVQEKDLPPELE